MKQLIKQTRWFVFLTVILMSITQIHAGSLINTQTPWIPNTNNSTTTNADASVTMTRPNETGYKFLFMRLSQTGRSGALTRDLVAGEKITVKIRAKSSSTKTFIYSKYLDFPRTNFTKVNEYEDFTFETIVKPNISKYAWLGLFLKKTGDTVTVKSVEILDGDTQEDTTPPVITLKGENPLKLKIGDSYIEAGATAKDDVDGDVSASIVINSRAVDTFKVGSYLVSYTASDEKENKSTKNRTVIVSDTIITPPTGNNLVISTTPWIANTSGTSKTNPDGSVTMTRPNETGYKFLYMRLSQTGRNGALSRDLIAGETVTVKIKAKSSSTRSFISSSYLDFDATHFTKVNEYQDFTFTTKVKSDISKHAWLGLFLNKTGDTVTVKSVEILDGDTPPSKGESIEGGVTKESAVPINVNEELTLLPTHHATYKGKPQRYAYYRFELINTSSVTITYTAPDDGGSYISISAAKDEPIATSWIEKGTTGSAGPITLKAGTYYFLINKNSTELQKINLKINVSSNEKAIKYLYSTTQSGNNDGRDGTNIKRQYNKDIRLIFTPKQKFIALGITNTFEYDSLKETEGHGYEYCGIPDEAHGYTAGKIGVTTATASVLGLLKKEWDRAPLNLFVTELERLAVLYSKRKGVIQDKELHDPTSPSYIDGLILKDGRNFCDVWKDTMKNNKVAFIKAQDNYLNNQRYQIAVISAEKYNLHLPISLAAFYDTQVLQGNIDVVAKYIGRFNGDTAEEEIEWLKKFNNKRYEIVVREPYWGPGAAIRAYNFNDLIDKGASAWWLNIDTFTRISPVNASTPWKKTYTYNFDLMYE